MEMPPTLADAARQIAAKRISPVELTRICLERIARIDANVHSFLLVTEERALADAHAAEARIMRDGPKGPLDGIPIGYKDIYNTAGIRTTGNSRLLADNVPASDATTVARLAEAGTVMLGKLANSEFATGLVLTFPGRRGKIHGTWIVPRVVHQVAQVRPWQPV